MRYPIFSRYSKNETPPTRVESFLQSNEAEESSISKHETDRPLQDKRFSLGKEILTIPFTASKDGREHTLKKKKRWSSPQLSNKDVWSSPQPPKSKRTPPPHALQQEESSFQVVRASLYKRAPLHLGTSLRGLEKSEETSLLAREDRAPATMYEFSIYLIVEN